MKKVMCLGLILVNLLWTTAIYADAITLVYHKFPPYEFQVNKKPAGIIVDIVQTIFDRVDVPLELEFRPFKRALREIKEGKRDGLFILYKTPERLEYFDYTEPVIHSPLVFFVRKDSDITFQTLSDLKGLTIGTFLGYTYGAEFDNYPGYTLEPTSSHEANMKKLVFGRIDAYICDKTVGIISALNAEAMPELKILPNPYKVMALYMVFTKGKHQTVIDKINPVIKSMNASGEIDNIIDTFITRQK